MQWGGDRSNQNSCDLVLGSREDFYDLVLGSQEDKE